MRLFSDNWIDYTATVITPATQDSILTAANIANALRKKVYRTAATQAAESITLDLGSAKAVTALILLDHTLTAGDSLLKLEGSTNNFASVAFTQALTWASGTILKTIASQTYRYWRISFTKSAAGETRDIGRVYLGTYDEFTEAQAPDYTGLVWEKNDPSKGIKSAGGVSYFDIQEKFDSFGLKFSMIDQTQVTTFETIFNRVGQTVSFFLQVDPANVPLDRVFYVKCVEDYKRPVKAFDAVYYWDTELKLEEQL